MLPNSFINVFISYEISTSVFLKEAACVQPQSISLACFDISVIRTSQVTFLLKLISSKLSFNSCRSDILTVRKVVPFLMLLIDGVVVRLSAILMTFRFLSSKTYCGLVMNFSGGSVLCRVEFVGI